jgi:hypothetical protein
VDDLTFEVGRGEVVGFLCAPSTGDGRCGRLLAGRRVPRVQRGRPAYVTGNPSNRIWVARTPQDFGAKGPVDILRVNGTYVGTVGTPARRRWRRFH